MSIKRRASLGSRSFAFGLRWGLRLAGIIVLLAIGLAVYFFHGAAYNRFYNFPREAAAWEAIAAQRRDVERDIGKPTYRGVCHAHSHRSHDSMITYPEILEAAHEAEIEFLLMSDHCVDGLADYGKGWRGVYDGVLFVRGYEMREGFMPWGLPEDVVLDCSEDPVKLARQIEEHGGLLFFAHTEEDRMWDLPQLDGMEIYNIHTLFIKADIGEMAPDIILSMRRYPDHVLRTIYQPLPEIHARWDELNKERRIVGIGGNDAHQNVGVRGFYTEDDTLLLLETGSDDVVREFELNLLTRPLLRWWTGPLEPGEKLFRIDLDPYERSLRFFNTHIIAEELSEEAILAGLEAGRVFVAFDMLADARGFVYYAENSEGKHMMGDEVNGPAGVELIAEAPYPVRFTLLRDGEQVTQSEGRVFEYAPETAGNYRLVADLDILGEWTPWLYTNPIRIQPES